MLSSLATLLGEARGVDVAAAVREGGAAAASAPSAEERRKALRRAYRHAVRAIHPDKLPGGAPLETRLLCEGAFHCLSEAAAAQESSA